MPQILEAAAGPGRRDQTCARPGTDHGRPRRDCASPCERRPDPTTPPASDRPVAWSPNSIGCCSSPAPLTGRLGPHRPRAGRDEYRSVFIQLAGERDCPKVVVEEESGSMVTVWVPLVPPDDRIADHRQRLQQMTNYWVPMLSA
ncbi:DUF5959 family protein [Streptomyces kebangsaanensis]|uniref:DUF5959 family protein n=1 Tax=Streptomyces kebangsaanensis TaxID=864058 RepID=UPI00389A65F5